MLGLATIFGAWATGLIAGGMIAAVLLPMALCHSGKAQHDVDPPQAAGAKPPEPC
jgi:hypothetical protein